MIASETVVQLERRSGGSLRFALAVEAERDRARGTALAFSRVERRERGWVSIVVTAVSGMLQGVITRRRARPEI